MKSKHNLKEIDQFVGKVRNIGSSLYVVIPMPNAQYAGLKPEDIVKVWFKKVMKK